MKTYIALVNGVVRPDSGRLTKPIERDPIHRTRMTAKTGKGRTALTEYRVLEKFADFTLLEIGLGTGRTHQIRVHMADLGHPVAGDKVYGKPSTGPRMFLHAARIGFTSPATGGLVAIEAPLPAELEQWLAGLRE